MRCIYQQRIKKLGISSIKSIRPPFSWPFIQRHGYHDPLRSAWVYWSIHELEFILLLIFGGSSPLQLLLSSCSTIFGKSWGLVNDILSVYECSSSSQYSNRQWGHLNLNCCYRIHLNFLNSETVETRVNESPNTFFENSYFKCLQVLKAKGTQYFTDYHLWFSSFTRPSYSNFTRAQRLTCCLSLLMSYMAVNAAWYRRTYREVRGCLHQASAATTLQWCQR